MSILLTLTVRSLHKLMTPRSGAGLSMNEVPAFAMRELQLHGLNVPASLLAGWSMHDLDRLRDRADKASCPCLVLLEDQPLAFGSNDASARAGAKDRVRRLGAAAHRLGCNAIAIHCGCEDSPESFARAAEDIRAAMASLDRYQLNLLIAPFTGLTHAPDRLAELIKKIGGFRIGALADFGHAHDTRDMVGALRKLAPYSGSIHATVRGFGKNGAHKDFDLGEAVNTVREVGFVNTLAIDYTGNGDPVASIARARDIIQKALEVEPA
jgi:sugar phosphate isomerase/epimerase